VRYHRGAEPKKKHRNFGVLDKPTRDRVRALAALLRVAAGFDRGHSCVVKQVRVRRGASAVRIAAVPRAEGEPVRLEAWGAHRKSRLLARLLGMPVEIVTPDGAVLSSEQLQPADAVG